MEKVKINYLSKEEIIYELCFRGVNIKPEDPVDILRKQLRANINTQGHVKNFNDKLVIKPEIDLVSNKIATLSTLLDNPDCDSALFISKISAKFTHLSHRLSNLSLCTNLKEEDVASVQKLLSQLEQLKSVFNEAVQKSSTISPEEITEFENKLNISLMEEEEVAYSLLNLSRDTSTPKHNTHAVNEPENTMPIFSLNPPCVSKPRENEEITTSHLVQPHSSSLFNKLSNPIEKYLQNFQCTDGLDVNGLLHFLRNLVKISTETSLSQQELYELLPNYCQAPLLNKVLSFKQSGLPISHLHWDILNTFVPITLKERLKQDLIYRPQMPMEPLGVYINEVKINSIILKTHHSEKELVSFIKQGIHPEIRNKLIFEQNPTSFADLDSLCISINNIGYSDFVRDNMFTPRNVFKGNNQTFNNRGRQFQNSVGPQNPKLCHTCHKPGHLAKQCWSKNKFSGQNFRLTGEQ
jgi:hypothetical protein